MDWIVQWSPDPVIADWGFFKLRWYSVMWALAVICGYFFAEYIFKREHRDTERVIDVVQYIFLGGLIGARLGEFVFYHPQLLLENPAVLFRVGDGGMASHGGLLGIVAALLLYCRKYKTAFSWIFDRLAIIGVWIVMLMRLGNLMNSELIGIPTNGNYGFVFVNTDPLLLPRHPVVLYEFAAYTILLVLMVRLYQKGAGAYPWLLSGLYFSVLVSIRFFLEFLKESDAARTFGISHTQWLSLPLILLGFVMVCYSLRKGEV